ncbi:MAG: class I SAM-dependent methyltransferase [Leptospira sp.]|nr:class I SAM-dependent methyltransferase [Leptospira sp.]NCS93999.1 class I SAM-dependent methyltransferase [Leptospira sp.]
MKQLEPYSLFAEIYDHSMRYVPYKDWSDYILKRSMHYSKNFPDAVLDLGCGTGRLLYFMEKNRKHASKSKKPWLGVDLSEAMILEAEKISSKIQWIQADIAEFAHSETFNLVISTHTTLNYFQNPEYMIAKAAELLPKNGIFFFDFTSEMNLIRNFDRKKIQETKQNLLLEWESSFDPKSKMIQVYLNFFHAKTKQPIGREGHPQYFHSSKSLEKIVKENGFRILEKGGDYDLEVKFEEADMCHMLCQKVK